MNPIHHPISHAGFRVFRLLLPLAILAVAGHVAANRPAAPPDGDGSVLPGAPAANPADPGAPAGKPAAAPKAAPLRVEIRTLKAGPAPYALPRGASIATTFVTDTPESLSVVAWARVNGRAGLADSIVWSVTPPAGFTVPEDARLRGPKLDLVLHRAGGNPNGGGGALALAVSARVDSAGPAGDDSHSLQQDPRDQLRQEYVDLERSIVPDRDALLDEEQFARRFGKKYPSVSFAELNWSRIPGTEDRYPAVLLTEDLVRALHRIRKEYGRPVVVSSGFRNPVRQTEVHASVTESYHQYGRAADLYVTPTAPLPDGTKIATEQDWLALAAASLRGGGAWIEPMLACHVNTAGCHVHVDVREEGPRSRLVRVRGLVRDPGGNPVAGATVRLAGMPAQTSRRGEFLLKHVLTPREQELQVEAPGRGLIAQTLELGEKDPFVEVRVPADPLPTMVARAAAVSAPASERVTVPVTLRNVGLSAARGLQVEARSGSDRVTVAQVLPARTATLGAGGELPLQIGLALPPGSAPSEPIRKSVPVALTAVYATPDGQQRRQELDVTAELVLLPASRPKPVAATPEPAPLPMPPSKGPDAGVAAGGLAAGAAAAAVGAAVKKRLRDPQPAPTAAEPSVDPGAPDPK